MWFCVTKKSELENLVLSRLFLKYYIKKIKIEKKVPPEARRVTERRVPRRDRAGGRGVAGA